MKSKFNIRYTWIFALFAIAFTSIFYAACTKDKTLTSDATTQTKQAADEEASMLAQAEQMGQTAYTHLRFNFLSHKAEDYINPALREKAMKDYNASYEAMKSLSTEERISKNLSDHTITEKQAAYFRSLLQTSTDLDNMTKFSDVEHWIDDYNRRLLDDKTMPNQDKQLILNASVTLKKVCDYMINIAYQPNKNAQSRTSDPCWGGKTPSCWTNVLLGGLQIGAGIIIPDPGTIVGGIVSTIQAVVSIVSDNSCSCGPTTCFTLLGISIFRSLNMGCDASSVEFCAWGQGTNTPQSFNWYYAELGSDGVSIVPGTVTNIPSGGRCISFVPNTDLNKKFIMKVTVDGGSNCSGGNVTKEFPFSWGDIAGNPGTVLIEGPTSPYVGMSASYYVNGSCLINPKNKFTWQYALSQGSFTFGNYVSGGGSNIPVTNTSQLSLNVNWTGISCGNGAFGQYGCNYCPCYTLSIGGFSHNDCSSNQSWGFASVKVYQ